ncbi:MAG TPA: 16S rRNA (cytosine(1402)-N(4))-methyltransferase RsmH [Prolixibacteraceae bacterium]|nr:16S rRNA (cytosine(1402)-N(4))-methyltransferase RsmH [Prolixibacteraceae bacterium]HPR60134.1 16S rRNA (cytosine(1402)-N(4))-methyltransferase RsmH [Prolixibacteraceae bacterium]
MNETYHIPVLLNESIEGLNIDPNGVYVDVTFGGGGHSSKILQKLESGKLVAFDQDADVLAHVPNDSRFLFAHHNFSYLKHFLTYYGFEQVDGILADLGVSSHDFDVAERGFSTRFDGALDMRMNQTAKLTAADVVNTYSEDDLFRILREYGEVNNARKAASVIVAARQNKNISTTGELVDVVRGLVPQKMSNKFLAQVFQALRIEVNNELDVLKSFLNDAYLMLKPGGRLVVISYHSLEDRLVKNFIQRGDFEGDVEKDFFGNIKLKFNSVGKKFISPNSEEIARNPRARSAKLRIAEKI